MYSEDPSRFFYDTKQSSRLFSVIAADSSSEQMISEIPDVTDGDIDDHDYDVLKSIGESQLKSFKFYPSKSPANLEDSSFALVENEKGATRLV